MSAKPLVAIMQPSSGYGLPYTKAAFAFCRASATIDRVELRQGTSMTTRTFNMLLCDALNHSRQHPFTHLAMIHDDVAPDGHWLDVLLSEMEATGADLVSAVVPIKNDQGVTSTAVDVDDPWNVRRLTMREVFNLPETFEAKDIPWNTHGKPLLANTGCFLAKWDRGWIDPFTDPSWHGDAQSGFRFHNRIVQAPDGAYVSQDRPEDWELSRCLARLGRRVACTRKVQLEHGHPRYHNRAPWGAWPTDLGHLEFTRLWQASQAVAPPPDWRFPEDIAGWLSQTEAKVLGNLARGKRVLEIGSYYGRSTVSMAQTAESLVAVDPFDGRATSDPRSTLPKFMEHLHRYRLLGKVTAHEGRSEDVLPTLTGQFGFAFIDGDHRESAVRKDAMLCKPLMASGGLVAFHDYGVEAGVTTVVDELARGDWNRLEVVDTVAVLEPG